MKSLLKNGKIEAMLPVYVNGVGDCTEIIANGVSEIKTVSVETCIKNIADFYNISLYHNRINYGMELGIVNKVPIVINEKLVYMYVNFRKPLFERDAAYGYIDINSVDEVLSRDDSAAVSLKSGIVIQTRQSVASLKKTLLYSKFAREIYKEKNFK